LSKRRSNNEEIMFKHKSDMEFPLLRSEEARLKREKKEKYSNYLFLWSAVLIPTGLIWYAYFHFPWVEEFLGSRYQIARFKITFSLLAVVLVLWGARSLFKKK
jgi:hypothetical protein